MADVELLLRDYGRDLDDRCPPVTVAELESHLFNAALSGDRVRPAGPLAGGDEPPNESTEEPIMLDLEVERPTHEPQSPRSPRWLPIAAAVMLIAGVGAAVLFATRSDEPTTPVSAQFTVDQALEVNRAYFEAYNAGDVDSLLALFTDDATFSANLVDPGELRLVWSVAQGTTLTPPECTIVDEIAGSAVVISCEYGTLQAPSLAIDEPAVPTTTEMTIIPDGISDLRDTYGTPAFGLVGRHFERWMDQNHPEDADTVGCCQGDTVEESITRGELRAQYSAEWAAYLEANDCAFNEGC